MEYRPPVLEPEVGREGVLLEARDNYQISCHGHKPLTWRLEENNTDSARRSVHADIWFLNIEAIKARSGPLYPQLNNICQPSHSQPSTAREEERRGRNIFIPRYYFEDFPSL